MQLSDILQADFWPSKVTACQTLNGLSGGSYRLELENGQCFLLRLQHDDLLRLGAARQFEGDLLFSLQLLSFVPTVFHIGDDFLVLHWIEGLPPTKWNEPHLARLADCLQQLHHFSVLHSTELSALPQLDLIQRIFFLLQQLPAEQQGCWLMQLDKLKPFNDCDVQIVGHHDLHRENIIVQADGSLKLLDWEYAAISNPALELAFMFANNDFNEKQQRYFLRRYTHSNSLIGQDRTFTQSINLYLPWVKLLNRLWLQVRRQF